MSSDLGIRYVPSFYVYALRDPDTRLVHYVGVTCNPAYRKATHWRDRLKGSDERSEWLRSLQARARRPEFVVLAVTTELDRFQAEAVWINRLQAKGHPLTNANKLIDQAVQRSQLSDMVTVSEAAGIKGVLAGTVRRRIERGKLKAIKKGGTENGGGVWLIRRQDLDSWVVRKKVDE